MTATTTDLTEYFLTIPLTRRNRDGSRDEHTVGVRVPAPDHAGAVDLGYAIALAIVERLPDVGDNNRYGWKIPADTNAVVAVAVAEEDN